MKPRSLLAAGLAAGCWAMSQAAAHAQQSRATYSISSGEEARTNGQASGTPAASAFDVREFGARGDGVKLDTDAIQRAVDACAGAGGGAVYFPPGVYLSGTVTLRSHVAVELGAGAVWRGSPRMEDYRVKHLVVADGAEDVTIRGDGMIDGNGAAFFDPQMRPRDRPSPLIDLVRCRGVRVEDVTIVRAPAWTLHPQDCDDVKIRGVTLLNDVRAINTDGIDVDSSRNVIISDCRIEAGDDCIVLKTCGRGGNEAAPTENVVVTNCTLVSAASALKLGTESRGDFRHILFSNCVIRDSRTGIALLAKDGGAMEDVRFANIAITTKPKWGQGLEWPIEIDVDKRTATSALSHIRDVALDGITVYTRGRVLVEGTPDAPIDGIAFHDVTIRITGYEEIKGAKKVRGGKTAGAGAGVDFGATPAAMIFGYVHGLTLDGVTVTWPDGPAPARNALYADHVEGYTFSALRLSASQPGVPPIHLSEVEKDAAAGGLRERIKENFFVPSPLPPLDAEVKRTFSPAPGVRCEAVTYTTQLGMRVPAILYLPDPLPAGKIPGFVVVNGHGGDKYSWYSYYAGVLFARGGGAVLTYDQAGEGERNSGRKSGTRAHDRLPPDPLLARHLAGLMITDAEQGTAYLASRPEVDPARIGAGGYSMGSFVLALTGAVDTRLHAAVMVGGGNLDGPGGYWDNSGKPLCQALPYRSLAFLGDRPAVLYALHADRGPSLIWNGRQDSVVGMPKTQDAFFLDLQNRVAALRGTRDGLFQFGFTPAVDGVPASHRPYFLTRPVVRWLNDQLHFPRWTDAQIEAMPETHISEWARARGASLEKMYATEEREGGEMALDAQVPAIPRQELNVFTDAEWPRVKSRYELEAWQAAASRPPPKSPAGK